MTSVPEDADLYGLGEASLPTGMLLPRNGTIITLWNRDIGSNVAWANLYGSHPFYLQVNGGETGVWKGWEMQHMRDRIWGEIERKIYAWRPCIAHQREIVGRVPWCKDYTKTLPLVWMGIPCGVIQSSVIICQMRII